MSARPARIVAEYEVNLARPRDLIEMPLTDYFADLRRMLWENLLPELQKTE
jgi:ABC-type nitrate/sulfonate/bicarbonate transport system ATPase subunit